eukprot:6184367-Pleurochrysis_carterae.AAC.2
MGSPLWNRVPSPASASTRARVSSAARTCPQTSALPAQPRRRQSTVGNRASSIAASTNRVRSGGIAAAE